METKWGIENQVVYLLPVIEQGPMLLIPVVTVVIVVCALKKSLKESSLTDSYC